MTFTRLTLAATATTLLVAVAACSPEDGERELPTADGSGPAAESADPGARSEAQLLEYDECMREHGVDMPEEGAAPSEDLDIDEETLMAAMESCEDLMPGGSLELDEGTVEELRLWAECMREEGIDMPDPGPDGALDPDGIDVTSEQYAAADATC